jgi:uncharacterized membrane protein
VPIGVAFIVPCFLSPIVSLGILLLILPPGNRSGLVTSIIIYSIICAIGTFLISFVLAIGGGTNPLETLFSEITGTIVGATLAYACVPLKSYGGSQK